MSKNVLTPKQNNAIRNLLTSGSMDAAARAAGVNPRTMVRWMQDDNFVAELHRAEGLALDETSRAVAALAKSALKVTAQIMANEEASDTVRIRAAQLIFDVLFRMRDARIDERLSRLEGEIL